MPHLLLLAFIGGLFVCGLVLALSVLLAQAVYVTDGDTLKSEHLFFDRMDFLGQLGLLAG